MNQTARIYKMNKKATILMLAATALLASCSQSEGLLPSGDLVPVTIHASLDEAIQTRAEGKTIGRCLLQVVENGVLGEVQKMTPSDGSYTASLQLATGSEYTFLFWADNASSTVSNLSKISYSSGIAYADRVEWNDQPTIEAELTHVATKVTLQTTGTLNQGKEGSIQIPKTYAEYNVATGKPSGTASEKSYTYSASSTINGTEQAPAEVTVFYALVDGSETQNLTLDSGAETPIPNVPLAPNTHVILRGDVQNVGFTTATITATANSNWETEESVEIKQP